MNDVSDILRGRMAEPQGLQRMAVISAAAHIALIALLIAAPNLLSGARSEVPPTVMTISLGGAAGPQSGGMTSMGGRPVQEERPADAPKRPEAVRPPAMKAPEMVAPMPNASRPRRPPAAAPVKQAPPEARGRTPTRGEKVTEGSAVADTGARGQGFGLSSGGGGGSGSTLDVGNFCCPDYLVQMVERIRSNWDARVDFPGVAFVKFTIQRDGRLTDIQLTKSSNFAALDLNAQRAVIGTRQLPPLPAEFTNPTLTVNLQFEYTR